MHTAKESAMEQISLKIDGMSCQGCVGSVRRVLLSLIGVSRATVSLENGTADIDYDPSLVTPDDLRRAVVAAGYEAE